MRYLITAAVAVGLLFLIFISVDYAWWRYRFGGYESGALELVSDCERASVMSASFNQESVLRRLPMNKFNGYCFRLDDNIDAALVSDASLNPQKDPGILLDFNGCRDDAFTVTKGRSNRGEKSISLTYVEGQYLLTSPGLPGAGLSRDELSSIHIRARHKEGTEMRVFLNSVPDGKDDNKGYLVRTIPDGEYHDYVLNMALELRGFASLYIPTIDSICVRPSNIEGDVVDIELVDIASKRERYLSKRYGIDYFTVKDEMRPCIFSASGVKTVYKLIIPSGGMSFETGIASLVENESLCFSVTVNDGGRVDKIFSDANRTGMKWRDIKLDLGRYAGRKVELSLSVSGEENGVGLWSNPVIRGARLERMNVIVYLEDALRADHLSVYGYDRDTSPVKQVFAREGALFLNACSQSSHTRSSTASLMSGMYPMATGVWNVDNKLQDEYLTLAEVLRSQGFKTAAAIQNPNAGPNNGTHQGFCQLVERAVTGTHTDQLYENFLYKWLEDNAGSNFFLYLHVLDPHGPYEPKSPYDKWYLETQKVVRGKSLKRSYLDPKKGAPPTKEGRISRYDGEILSNDTYFGGFLNKLKQLGIYDNTLIIFIADHGEHLGEHGIWHHVPPGFDNVTHIPMVMVYPAAIPRGKVISQNVQSIDVMPTILDYCGIESSGMLTEGRSLGSLINGKEDAYWDNRVTISDQALFRTGKDDRRALGSTFYKEYHYLETSYLKAIESVNLDMDMDVTPKGNRFLFDRADDPHENRGLLKVYATHRMAETLASVQEINFGIRDNMTVSMPKIKETDPAVSRNLETLGYAQ